MSSGISKILAPPLLCSVLGDPVSLMETYLSRPALSHSLSDSPEVLSVPQPREGSPWPCNSWPTTPAHGACPGYNPQLCHLLVLRPFCASASLSVKGVSNSTQSLGLGSTSNHAWHIASAP